MTNCQSVPLTSLDTTDLPKAATSPPTLASRSYAHVDANVCASVLVIWHSVLGVVWRCWCQSTVKWHEQSASFELNPHLVSWPPLGSPQVPATWSRPRTQITDVSGQQTRSLDVNSAPPPLRLPPLVSISISTRSLVVSSVPASAARLPCHDLCTTLQPLHGLRSPTRALMMHRGRSQKATVMIQRSPRVSSHPLHLPSPTLPVYSPPP